jgi:hypothetical protein
MDDAKLPFVKKNNLFVIISGLLVTTATWRQRTYNQLVLQQPEFPSGHGSIRWYFLPDPRIRFPEVQNFDN